jgi:ABC-type transporter Mla subunit MlaD
MPYTTRLHERIRTATFGDTDLSLGASETESGFTPPLRDLLDNLQHLQRTLNDLQQRVHQNIKAVKHALRDYQ